MQALCLLDGALGLLVVCQHRLQEFEPAFELVAPLQRGERLHDDCKTHEAHTFSKLSAQQAQRICCGLASNERRLAGLRQAPSSSLA